MPSVETRAESQIAEEAKLFARACYDHGHAHFHLEKAGGTPIKVHALSGRLYLSSSGWLMLSVPNAIGLGAFDALNEPGVELPKDSSGRYNAHVSVMRPEEIEQIGGADKITERGHSVDFGLGSIKEVEPGGWSEMSKVWYLTVTSPRLSEIRRSYGLSSLPNDDKYEFHMTFAVKKKKVTQTNEVSKAAEDNNDASTRLLSLLDQVGEAEKKAFSLSSWPSIFGQADVSGESTTDAGRPSVSDSVEKLAGIFNRLGSVLQGARRLRPATPSLPVAKLAPPLPAPSAPVARPVPPPAAPAVSPPSSATTPPSAPVTPSVRRSAAPSIVATVSSTPPAPQAVQPLPQASSGRSWGVGFGVQMPSRQPGVSLDATARQVVDQARAGGASPQQANSLSRLVARRLGTNTPIPSGGVDPNLLALYREPSMRLFRGLDSSFSWNSAPAPQYFTPRIEEAARFARPGGHIVSIRVPSSAASQWLQPNLTYMIPSERARFYGDTFGMSSRNVPSSGLTPEVLRQMVQSNQGWVKLSAISALSQLLEAKRESDRKNWVRKHLLMRILK